MDLLPAHRAAGSLSQAERRSRLASGKEAPGVLLPNPGCRRGVARTWAQGRVSEKQVWLPTGTHAPTPGGLRTAPQGHCAPCRSFCPHFTSCHTQSRPAAVVPTHWCRPWAHHVPPGGAAVQGSRSLLLPADGLLPGHACRQARGQACAEPESPRCSVTSRSGASFHSGERCPL